MSSASSQMPSSNVNAEQNDTILRIENMSVQITNNTLVNEFYNGRPFPVPPKIDTEPSM
ncbi:17815_t:CDS:2 [Funneliformis geosporum]|uniref:14286_t:CDS:1 n=1 Tax=Funneliformis geosporum TaxID=1117311 RepID=A0A9W4WM44_9GLOM|nr:17815_t:CDS:2 [Funneliformis geosporum]CAI2164137.1 14286_t:CDS:2 [Funneliformis geosporum]